MILNIGRREEKVEDRTDIRWSWLLMPWPLQEFAPATMRIPI